MAAFPSPAGRGRTAQPPGEGQTHKPKILPPCGRSFKGSALKRGFSFVFAPFVLSVAASCEVEARTGLRSGQALADATKSHQKTLTLRRADLPFRLKAPKDVRTNKASCLVLCLSRHPCRLPSLGAARLKAARSRWNSKSKRTLTPPSPVREREKSGCLSLPGEADA